MEDHVGNFRYFQEQFNNLKTYDEEVREDIAELKERSQAGTLQEYFEPFQSLFQDGWVSEELAVSFFLGGLRDEIRNSVSILKPRTLNDAYTLAWLQEFSLPALNLKKNDAYKFMESIEAGKFVGEVVQKEVALAAEATLLHELDLEETHEKKLDMNNFLDNEYGGDGVSILDINGQKQEEFDCHYDYDVGSFEAASPRNHVREVSGKKPKELMISNSLILANPKLWPFEVVVDLSEKYVEDGESDKERKMVACGSQKEPESESSDKDYGDMSQMGQLLSTCSVRTAVFQTNSWFSTERELALMLVLAILQRKHGHFLIVDVAHETITCGKNGGVIAEAFIYRGDIIICVDTRSMVLGNQGGLTTCSTRRKLLMLARVCVAMFSAMPPILLVVVAHATVAVAGKEAWCRRKKRPKELHARRFLAATFENKSVIARRLKPPWEFGFLAVDAFTLEISLEVYSMSKARQKEFHLSGGRLIEGVVCSVNKLLEKFYQSCFLNLLTYPGILVSVGIHMIPFAVIVAPLTAMAASLYRKGNGLDQNAGTNELAFSLRSFLWLDAAKRGLTQEVIYYGLVNSSIEASPVDWFLLYATHYIQHKYSEECDSHTFSMEFSGLFFDGTSVLHLANFLHKITMKIESDLAEHQLELFVVNSQLMPPFPLEEPIRCLSSAKQGENLFFINKFFSSKDISLSLHELISNATDTLHKIHFGNLMDKSKLDAQPKLLIDLVLDKTNNALSTIASGLGMTEAELVSNLCTKEVLCDLGSSSYIQFQVNLGRLDFYVTDFSLGRYRGFRFKIVHVRKKQLGQLIFQYLQMCSQLCRFFFRWTVVQF